MAQEVCVEAVLKKKKKKLRINKSSGSHMFESFRHFCIHELNVFLSHLSSHAELQSSDLCTNAVAENVTFWMF